MTREERIKAVLRGEQPDRVPVSVWMHLSEYDQDPRSLAEAMVDFNERYDFDFIKMMPFGAYTVPDWGAKLDIFCTKYQEVEISAPGIASVEDYYRMEVLPAAYGTWGKTLQTAQWVARDMEARKCPTPFMQTIFSPLTTLKKLAGERCFADMLNCPEAVHYALDVITQTTINFVKANIEAGVSGFFFATQCATYDLMTDIGYAEFGRPYDLRVIDAYKDQTWLNVLHIHGKNTMFETMCRYPLPVLNWHDRQDGPSMAEAKKLTDKVFLGGLREGPAIVDNRLVYDSIMSDAHVDAAAIEAHIHEVMDVMEGKRLLIGPGCVADPHSSAANIAAVRKSVETWKH